MIKDKFLLSELNKAYPNKNSSYRINRDKMSAMMNEIFQYGQYTTLDEIFAILRECEKENLPLAETIGELHLYTSEKLSQVKGPSYYQAKSMGNIEWLISHAGRI